jgi:hypothetical protein
MAALVLGIATGAGKVWSGVAVRADFELGPGLEKGRHEVAALLSSLVRPSGPTSKRPPG